MTQHVTIYARLDGPRLGILSDIRQTVEHRDAIVLGVYLDDARITGRGKYAEWRNLIARLDGVDQLALSNAGDIPGRTLNDLLKIVGLLRDRGVGLYLHAEGLDTGTTSFALLDIIQAFRDAKLSEAIRAGQMRARASGKIIGRPIVPLRIQTGIRNALAQGGGVRPTARRFDVSPASVINIRRTMTVVQCTCC